jgi:hypothetical protein
VRVVGLANGYQKVLHGEVVAAHYDLSVHNEWRTGLNQSLWLPGKVDEQADGHADATQPDATACERMDFWVPAQRSFPPADAGRAGVVIQAWNSICTALRSSAIPTSAVDTRNGPTRACHGRPGSATSVSTRRRVSCIQWRSMMDDSTRIVNVAL